MLTHSQALALSESETITYIYEVNAKQFFKYQKSTKANQFLLVANTQSVVYVLNYCTCEKMYRFDVANYRCQERARAANMQISCCYFMKPYFHFDILENPVVYLVDNFGACFINLQAQELY